MPGFALRFVYSGAVVLWGRLLTDFGCVTIIAVNEKCLFTGNG